VSGLALSFFVPRLRLVCWEESFHEAVMSYGSMPLQDAVEGDELWTQSLCVPMTREKTAAQLAYAIRDPERKEAAREEA
jgi:hypothetical protein